MEGVRIKPVADNLIELKATITKGKLLALTNALRMSGTPVATDLLDMVICAAEINHIDV